MKRSVKLYNVLLPIWILYFFPQVWLITLPGNLLIDCLVLLLTLFLLPLLLLGEEPLAGPSQPPAATGTLPIDRTVVTPGQTADGRVQVRVALGDGEVLTLPLDKYLWRVVAAEMPASFEPEALKAQTVAARTYTLSKMERTVEAHPDADVCTDITCCQAYIDPADAAANWGENAQTYTDKIAAAVADTDGLAALFRGQPIQAVFFSSAAGRTVDAVEVWGNAVPYLTSVDSPEGDEVPNYHSTVTVPLDEFKSKLLAQYPQADLSGEPAGWFANLVPNSAGVSKLNRHFAYAQQQTQHRSAIVKDFHAAAGTYRSAFSGLFGTGGGKTDTDRPTINFGGNIGELPLPPNNSPVELSFAQL